MVVKFSELNIICCCLSLDQVASAVLSQEKKARHLKKIVDKQSKEISTISDITSTISGFLKVFSLYLQ